MNSIAVISNSVFLDRDKSAFQFFHYFRGFIPIRCNRVNNLLTGPSLFILNRGLRGLLDDPGENRS